MPNGLVKASALAPSAHKIRINKDTRIVKGLCATYEIDQVGDQFVPGCWSKTLREKHQSFIDRGAPSRIAFLWDHDPSSPIGTPLVLKETHEGLYFEAKISRTQKGDELIELINDGSVSGFSVRCHIVKQESEKSGVRRILEAKLTEFSAVTFPCQLEARAKSDPELATLSKKFSQFEETQRRQTASIEKLIGLVNGMTGLEADLFFEGIRRADQRTRERRIGGY